MDKSRAALSRAVHATLDNQSAVNQKMNHLIDEMTRKHGISRTNYNILRFLKQEPDGVEPSVIAENLSLLRQTVSNVVFEMEKSGVVECRKHPTDRRRLLVSLTPEGEKMEEEISAEIRQLHQAVFEKFTDDEMLTYLDLRNRITDAMKEVLKEEFGVE